MSVKITCPCCGRDIILTIADENNNTPVCDVSKFKIIAIMGPSGSGKTTLIDKLMTYDKKEQQLHKIVATTTRPKRDNENDNDYHFVGDWDFEKQRHNMLETTEFRDWYYGTNVFDLSLDNWNIGVFSPKAVKQLSEHPEVVLRVFYLNVDEKTRIIRAVEREENPDVAEIARRILADREDFSQENLTFSYNELPFYDNNDLLYAMDAIYPTDKNK